MLKTINPKLKKELLEKTEWDRVKYDCIYSIEYIPKKKKKKKINNSNYIKYKYFNVM